jgi:hypothetical protein
VRAFWVARVHLGLGRFPADPRGSVRHRPPALASAGSSSPGLSSSSEFQPLQPARRAHATSTSHRVPSLHRDVRAESPLTGSDPDAAFVPPSVFRTPSTACSSLLLAGLFHPATTSEVSSSGVSPDGQQDGLFTRLCPLVGCQRPPAGELPRPRQLAPPRLQGLDPAIDSVAPIGGLAPRGTRIPS